jgi:hypothetical protein
MIDNRTDPRLDDLFARSLRHADIRPHPAVLRTLRERTSRRKPLALSQRVSAFLQAVPVYQAVGAAAVVLLLVTVGRSTLGPAGSAGRSAGLHEGPALESFLAGALDTPLARRDSLVNPADSTSRK